jgi:hypothetical protein
MTNLTVSSQEPEDVLNRELIRREAGRMVAKSSRAANWVVLLQRERPGLSFGSKFAKEEACKQTPCPYPHLSKEQTEAAKLELKSGERGESPKTK